MPTAAPAPAVMPSTTTAAAARAAERNWRANRASLSARQPSQAAALDACEADLPWYIARDGTLSTRDADGHWFAGCSVPLLAGRALLRSLVVEPGGHCLLAPAHVGLIVAARERLGPAPVLFVVQPDRAVCRTILACGDLSRDLASGRLWFAAGDNWATEFRRALHDHPGLAAPARFIQTRLTPDAAVEPLISQIQQVIGPVAACRGRALDVLLRDHQPVEPGRTVLLADSRFRLWGHGFEPLRDALGASGGRAGLEYDLDNPLTATPIALARATAGAAAVVAINLVRGDAAAVVSDQTRWITWQTSPAMPAAVTAGSMDHLIVADPAWRESAVVAGWPRHRVHVGTCAPTAQLPPAPKPGLVGIIADTVVTSAPDAVRGYSSHQVLWESIAAELCRDPLVVTDPTRYLADRAERHGIAVTELTTSTFVDGLILPAYLQGLARRLIEAGVPVRLHGQGWPDLPEFASHAAGPVSDTGEFRSAVAASAVLARPVPGYLWHPVDTYGRPVLQTFGLTSVSVAAQASALLRGSAQTPPRYGKVPPTLGQTLALLLEPPVAPEPVSASTC